ncbi:MAG: insulinase family protein [Akkermansiaceae bacterium]|nr:insulinase family protein [Akkermansiaceae bacterium]
MEYPATTATVETLPNGLTLILDPDSAAPVVSCQIWVETGSLHEDDQSGTGISHFLEHMVFKGTRDFDADTLATTVQGAGGHWNAYTTFDRTVYYIDGPSDSLDLFLKCLSGLVFFPTLPESEFAGEQDVIRREIDMGLDDPDNAATRLLLATAFQHDPRRQPVIGHRHLFDTITHADLVRYHRERYTTNRCFVVISGDFDPDAARAAILDLTKDLQPGGGREPHVPVDLQQLGPRKARETFDIPTSRISMAWKVPPLEHPDAPACDLLATMLGRGKSSILHHTLRDERELALEISAFCWNDPGREGLLAIQADAEVEKRDVLIEAIRETVADLAERLDDADIAKAKRQILVSQFRSLTTASGRASDLASNWRDARDLDFTRSHVAAIEAVTADDLRRVAARLTPSRMILTVLDPLGAPAPARSSRTRAKSGGIRVHHLSNGIPLALIPDPRTPLVGLQAAARAGLPSETQATNGINQLLAASLPKGAAGRSAAEIARTLESLGAGVGASAGNNALLVNASCVNEDLATVLHTVCDVLARPDFPADAVARERASQLAALEETLRDPLHAGFRALRRALFRGTGYGLDPLGSPDSLKALDRDALAAHHARHFTAANLTLAVAGHFDPDLLIDLLERGLTGLPAGDRWSHPRRSEGRDDDPLVRLPKKQAVLAIGFPGGGATDPDRHALALIQEYASDMAGPLSAAFARNSDSPIRSAPPSSSARTKACSRFTSPPRPNRPSCTHQCLIRIAEHASGGLTASAPR